MFGIGFQEMLIILVVVLIFFGPKRLPDLAKSLGKGIAEFKKASEEVKKGIDEAMKEEIAKEEPPAPAIATPPETPTLPAETKGPTPPQPPSQG
ncbi:MAG: twin-arginine translocase subunit TatB [Deltaproteobacteria bacterium]|nr:twin-arginine translocase subunit TatB [Deltaproteobacteria bacterium]